MSINFSGKLIYIGQESLNIFLICRFWFIYRSHMCKSFPMPGEFDSFTHFFY